MSRRIINDKVPDIIDLRNLEIGLCSGDKEFFQLLRQNLVRNVNKIFDLDDAEKKLNALFDAEFDLSIIREKFQKKLGDTIDKKRQERYDKIGGYDNRLVVDEVSSRLISKADVKKVEQFGKDNGYPAMILAREDGKISKKIGKGENAWKEAIAWSQLIEPYRSNFFDLLRAVNENDIYDDEE